MSLHICRVPEIARIRRVLYCRSCRTRRRHIIRDFAWYGFEKTCCHCGIRYNDGWLRKSTKRQRVEQSAAAKQAWNDPFDRSAEYWADYREHAA